MKASLWVGSPLCHKREATGKSASEAIRRGGVSAGEKAVRRWNFSRELKELCYG